MRKIFFLLFFLFFLAVLQTSFFNFLKVQPNLILVFLLSFLIFYNARENPIPQNNNFEPISVILAGLFLDASSGLFLGTGILTFLLIFYFMKIVLKNVRAITLFLFSALVLLGTVFFEIFLPIVSFGLGKIFNVDSVLFNFSYSLLLRMIYNIILGIIAFYVLKIYQRKFAQTNGIFYQ